MREVVPPSHGLALVMNDKQLDVDTFLFGNVVEMG